MADKPWKVEERKIAKMFGTERRLMKGTREKADIGDDDFPLVLDVKLRKSESWEVRKWFKEVFHEANRQDKIPVVSMRPSSKHTRYAMIRQYDLHRMIKECPDGTFKAEDFFSSGQPHQKKWQIIIWYKELVKRVARERYGAIPLLVLNGTRIHTQIGMLVIMKTEHLADIFMKWREAVPKENQIESKNATDL